MRLELLAQPPTLKASRRSRAETVTAQSRTETVTAPRVQEELPDGNRDSAGAQEKASIEEAAARAELLELEACGLRVKL